MHKRASKLRYTYNTCLISFRMVNSSIGCCSFAFWNTPCIQHRTRLTNHAEDRSGSVKLMFFSCYLQSEWSLFFYVHMVFCYSITIVNIFPTNLRPVRQSHNSTCHTFPHKTNRPTHAAVVGLHRFYYPHIAQTRGEGKVVLIPH